MNPALLNDYLQLIAHTVTILGLPLALLIFYREKRRERQDREYGTYDALDNKYTHFLELCLERPELDVFDLPFDSNEMNATARKKRQEEIMFLILISIIERAYLMYKDQNTAIKKRQWEGWVAYMKHYSKRQNFRQRWPEFGPNFDHQFVAFMDTLIHETQQEE
ncbi:hypothetical protein OOT00_05335 [Desulfobotulus sp. H1]|uniref:DUF4760 domain-containing protein n=1 Tax=Desulfobotulus pelophilus TaxID=2823377 RepID=A0ABT3N7H4_9BACT|nr:hypothetical protein [Desulfobotulus pelophilus]MCW7753408.1 hypothetical protein [Desulfobotulus pelophilus]